MGGLPVFSVPGKQERQASTASRNLKLPLDYPPLKF
jgi:hypothetical protein